jgi:hypothetical protein
LLQNRAYRSPRWLLLQYTGPPQLPQMAMPASDHFGERALVGTIRCCSRRRWQASPSCWLISAS